MTHTAADLVHSGTHRRCDLVSSGPGRGPRAKDRFTEPNERIFSPCFVNSTVTPRRHAQDVALMAAMGLRHYRFSLAWPRLMPDGTPASWNAEGVAFYHRLLDLLDAAGIEVRPPRAIAARRGPRVERSRSRSERTEWRGEGTVRKQRATSRAAQRPTRRRRMKNSWTLADRCRNHQILRAAHSHLSRDSQSVRGQM